MMGRMGFQKSMRYTLCHPTAVTLDSGHSRCEFRNDDEV